MELEFSKEKLILNDDIFRQLKEEVKKIIVGNDQTIDLALIALITNGHILFEGPPGVAKTTLVKTICDAIGLEFKRIQFTPDLLPGDLIGTQIYNQKTNNFETRRGPIFANLILADEINRAPAKVQSALLEAMQESQVTIGSESYSLEKPFLVFATQNPIESAGTYTLPEAQMDRFMFKIKVTYPSKDNEIDIIKKQREYKDAAQVISKKNILDYQLLVNKVYNDERILKYIVNIIDATRNPENHGLENIKECIKFGASPRATIALEKSSRANALTNSRSFVIPEDIKFLAKHILNHRIILSYEAIADGIDSYAIINEIIQKVKLP